MRLKVNTERERIRSEQTQTAQQDPDERSMIIVRFFFLHGDRNHRALLDFLGIGRHDVMILARRRYETDGYDRTNE